MASPIRLYQGADRDIVLTHNDANLATASEIEVRIDTPTQIEKTLTGGGVSGVTSSQFTVTIEDADTDDVLSGEYRIQCRSTKAGIVTQGEINPQFVQIVDSIFTDTE